VAETRRTSGATGPTPEEVLATGLVPAPRAGYYSGVTDPVASRGQRTSGRHRTRGELGVRLLSKGRLSHPVLRVSAVVGLRQ